MLPAFQRSRTAPRVSTDSIPKDAIKGNNVTYAYKALNCPSRSVLRERTNSEKLLGNGDITVTFRGELQQSAPRVSQIGR
jgi:uncharacterized protein (UPF0128 family)